MKSFYLSIPMLLLALIARAGSASIYDLPYHFIDDSGKSLQLSQWRGETNIVTFAYATCRKTCVETLHRLERMQAEADSAKKAVNFFVVSYDPETDTPQTWTEYRAHHHLTRSNWHFLTASVDETHGLASWLNFKYWTYDDHVMHDFKIVLLNSEGTPEKTMDWNKREERWF